jgi:hypothetical protein
MGKYGQAAIRAIDLLISNKVETPVNAWEAATIEIFGEGTSSQMKGCPKTTFIGLCESGMVLGVQKGTYLKNKNSKNKMYGIEAIKLLNKEPSLSRDIKQLWSCVLEGENKQHNAQMDVVVTLWNNNLIVVKECLEE